MRVIFRVDSSYKIGTGHLMRCLTLADELKMRDAEVEFVSRDCKGNLAKLAVDQGYKLHLLKKDHGENENYCAHSSWLETRWQDDAEETAAIAKGADCLVVDHYAIDARWEKLVAEQVKKIVVIDDLADRAHHCNLLLDQNYYRDAYNRYNGLLSRDCTLLLTPKYALLRQEFADVRKSLRARNENVKNILVFFGGVDADNNTIKALRMLADFTGEVIIIAGGANRNLPELEKFCHGRSNFKLLATANNMAELIAWADLAIGSGGATSWERACLGLPSFVWPIADNQVPILRDLDELGAVKLTSPDELTHDISRADLNKMSDIAKTLTDGNGATRVANYITYNLRKAELKDCRRIWEIRNLAAVRENSNSAEIIEFVAHEKWFKAALVNDKRYILVLAKGDEIVGVLRFDVEDEVAETSIYLNPKYFDLGLGENLLERGLAYIQHVKPDLKIVTAQILDKNLKSKALFAKFEFVGNKGLWQKNLKSANM